MGCISDSLSLYGRANCVEEFGLWTLLLCCFTSCLGSCPQHRGTGRDLESLEKQSPGSQQWDTELPWHKQLENIFFFFFFLSPESSWKKIWIGLCKIMYSIVKSGIRNGDVTLLFSITRKIYLILEVVLSQEIIWKSHNSHCICSFLHHQIFCWAKRRLERLLCHVFQCNELISATKSIWETRQSHSSRQISIDMWLLMALFCLFPINILMSKFLRRTSWGKSKFYLKGEKISKK